MSFDEFLDEALVAGKGRQGGGSRLIPAFIPGGGAQDALFDQSLETLTKNTFQVFDVRGPDGYRRALTSFALGWPCCKGPSSTPDELYPMEIPEETQRLLIVCGPERMPRFWQHLRKASALHMGAIFPPFMEPQEPCIIVPDAACVCVLVKERDSSAIPDGTLNPSMGYTTLKSKWMG